MSEHDLSIDGPTLTADAIRTGLVDEYTLIIAPTEFLCDLASLLDSVADLHSHPA